jgi:hypothetical protein
MSGRFTNQRSCELSWTSLTLLQNLPSLYYTNWTLFIFRELCYFLGLQLCIDDKTFVFIHLDFTSMRVKISSSASRAIATCVCYIAVCEIEAMICDSDSVEHFFHMSLILELLMIHQKILTTVFRQISCDANTWLQYIRSVLTSQVWIVVLRLTSVSNAHL